ncbi:MAG: hypothetical protein GX121_03650 [Ignavibacteria bacterium]|nr:hypothetical protein [Ignavibacteria bacterium]
MNIEELISKYLDGNLTNDEDAWLRSYVNSNIKAKNSFEQSVLLFSLMKKDAQSIRVPKKLLSNTEDIIMMKYISSEPRSINQIPRKRSFKQAYSLIAASLAFLFLNLFFISDFEYKAEQKQVEIASDKMQGVIKNELPLSKETAQKQVKKTVVENISQNSSDGSLPIVEIVKSIEISKNIDTVKHDNSNFETFAAQTMEQSIDSNEGDGGAAALQSVKTSIDRLENRSINNNINQQKEEYAFSILQSFENELLIESSQNDLHFQKLSSIGQYQLNVPSNSEIYQESFFSNNPININSFFGTDIVRSGISKEQKALVSNFSQSVAYSIAENHSIGAEFGYSNYSYVESFVAKDAPAQKKGSSSTIFALNDLKPIPNEFSAADMSFDRNKQIYWAAAFYELLMLNSSRFSFKSRIGAGIAEEGPLGYGRVFSCYQLFNGFNITIGTEGKIFYSRFPEITRPSKEMKATFSIIYGFQINL